MSFVVLSHQSLYDIYVCIGILKIYPKKREHELGPYVWPIPTAQHVQGCCQHGRTKIFSPLLRISRLGLRRDDAPHIFVSLLQSVQIHRVSPAPNFLGETPVILLIEFVTSSNWEGVWPRLACCWNLFTVGDQVSWLEFCHLYLLFYLWFSVFSMTNLINDLVHIYEPVDWFVLWFLR